MPKEDANATEFANCVTSADMSSGPHHVQLSEGLHQYVIEQQHGL